MKRASLVIWVTAGILVVAALTLAILLLAPVSTKLDEYRDRARDATHTLSKLETSAVGESYERNLGAFAQQRAEKAAEVQLARGRLASKLDLPFRDMKIEAGANGPTFEDFQRAYNFNGDQLKIRIRDLVARAGGPEAKDIQLIAPPFSQGTMDAAAIARWQRVANLEARLLDAAAKMGAAPAARVRIDDEPAPPDDTDASYLRQRVGLDYFCREGRTSAVVHALLAAFDDSGGLTRLVGLSEAPVPEDRLKEAHASAPKKLSITLIVGFPVPIGEAP